MRSSTCSEPRGGCRQSKSESCKSKLLHHRRGKAQLQALSEFVSRLLVQQLKRPSNSLSQAHVNPSLQRCPYWSLAFCLNTLHDHKNGLACFRSAAPGNASLVWLGLHDASKHSRRFHVPRESFPIPLRPRHARAGTASTSSPMMFREFVNGKVRVRQSCFKRTYCRSRLSKARIVTNGPCAKHRPRSADLRFTLVAPNTPLWPSLLHVGTNQARLTCSG